MLIILILIINNKRGVIFMKKVFFLTDKKSDNSILNIFSPKHTILVVSLIIGILISAVAGVYSSRVQTDLAKNLLRLHIIANSDTKEDQELKLKVRDAIIKEMSSKFSLSNNIEETKKIAQDNISNIENIAKNVIVQNGKDYSVKAELANVYFPTKYYGDIALPPGNYDAVRVEIGKAKGHNWWCVLFPPLCFVDAANGKLQEGSKDKLKVTLSQSEYELISNASRDENLPVKIKFKSIEIWEESTHQVQVALSKIF